jgi:Protein of unknown function (DUF1565)
MGIFIKSSGGGSGSGAYNLNGQPLTIDSIASLQGDGSGNITLEANSLELDGTELAFDSDSSVTANGSGALTWVASKETHISSTTTANAFTWSAHSGSPLILSNAGVLSSGVFSVTAGAIVTTAVSKIPITLGKNIYVDGTAGNSAYNGSATAPLDTIAHAVAVAASGQTIVCAPGTYNEAVLLPAGVSLVGSGPGPTVISFSGTLAYGSVLVPGTGSYVANVTILRPRGGSGGNGGGVAGFNANVLSPAQNAQFFNVTFSGDFDNVYCIAGGSIPTYTAEGYWTSGTTYSANQWVLYGDIPYLCTTGLTSTTIPPQDATHWTPMVYWTFRNCTFLSSWDCTNLSWPMFADFIACNFDQGPNPSGYNAIGSAIQPGSASCNIRVLGCSIRQTATSGSGGGTAFNASSNGNITVRDTSVDWFNGDGGSYTPITAYTNGAGQTITIGGGCSFNNPVYSSSAGTISIQNGPGVFNFAGNLTTSGAYASTFTMTGATSVTFPTSGTLATTSAIPAANNPTGTLGLSAVNGSASTFMRSDAAPLLSQGIAPTWTGSHTFNSTSFFTKLGGSSSAPTAVAGAGAGGTPGTPTLSAGSTDISGNVSITTGTLPSASAVVITVTFNKAAFTNAPFVELTPANAATALLSGATMVYLSATTGTFVINAGATGLVAATAYSWNYHVMGN